MKLTWMLLMFGLCVSSLTQNVEARTHRVWSNSQLMEMADLVVIANPLGSKEVVEKQPAKKDLQEVETTFQVEVVLKGKIGPPAAAPAGREEAAAARTIVLHHYTYADTVRYVINGYRFAEFNQEKHKVLLYLKKLPNGSYAPVTGQDDAVDSVRVISEYPQYGHKRREDKARSGKKVLDVK